MQTIYVLRGLPGSGKSTIAREFIAARSNPEDWVRLNKDDLRLMFHAGVFSKDREKFVHETFMKLVQMALSAGKNIVLDNTHITNDSVRPYHHLAERLGNIVVSETWIRVPLEQCLARNAERVGPAKVPYEAVMNMAARININGNKFCDERQYNHLKDALKEYPEKPYIQNDLMSQDPSLPGAIICDLDGTLAFLNGRNPYDASSCEEDSLNDAVWSCIVGMMGTGHSVVFVSGRSDLYEKQTRAFIEKNCLEMKHTDDGEPAYGPINYQLHMRHEGDTRKDAIIKQEIFDEKIRGKYNIKFVLDDRNQVVEFWRSIGLACFQVNPGDF